MGERVQVKEKVKWFHDFRKVLTFDFGLITQRCLLIYSSITENWKQKTQAYQRKRNCLAFEETGMSQVVSQND